MSDPRSACGDEQGAGASEPDEGAQEGGLLGRPSMTMALAMALAMARMHG